MPKESKIGPKVIIGPHVEIGKGAVILGDSVIADNAFIGEDCVIDNSFICGTTVVMGSTVRNSIIRGNTIVQRGSQVYASKVDSCAIRQKTFIVGSEIEHSTVSGKLNNRILSRSTHFKEDD